MYCVRIICVISSYVSQKSYRRTLVWDVQACGHDCYVSASSSPRMMIISVLCGVAYQDRVLSEMRIGCAHRRWNCSFEEDAETHCSRAVPPRSRHCYFLSYITVVSAVHPPPAQQSKRGDARELKWVLSSTQRFGALMID